MESWVQSSRPRTNAFCAPVTQNHLPKLTIWCSKMQPVSGNQRPDLLTSLTENASFSDPRQMSHACHRFWKCYKTLTFCSLLTKSTIPYPCHAKRHLNVQKCSGPFSFSHFWLRNVLRATTACTFLTSQLPKVLWTHQFFTRLTSKCASPHNGVQFFISHLASWLRSFRPSGATHHWKNRILPFRAPGSSFFWDSSSQIHVREKVGKSRNTVFFQWFVAPEGRKVGSLKRPVRGHVTRWWMKNCTQLWREAHLQVKKKLFRGRCSTEKSQNGLVRGRKLCTQLSIFEGSLAELLRFWCCQLPKIEEVSQNYFVFDAVKFKICGGLTELIRFWRCQVQKLRKSRRIASFSSLHIDR